MRTPFRNQHPVTVFERVNRCRACQLRREIAFIARKQGRKRRQPDVFRHRSRHFPDRLAVGNDQRRFCRQPPQHIRNFAFLNRQRHRSGIQHFAQNLHLRQYQPPFRRRQVNRHHQHHQVFRLNQVRCQRRLVRQRFQHLGHTPFQRVDALAGLCRNCHPVIKLHHRPVKFAKLPLVAEIKNRNKRNALLRQFGKLCFVFFRKAVPADNQQYHIRAAQDFLCRLHALPPELAFVVQPRRVIKADRPDRYQLIRFRHRVGRRPQFVGNNRHLLPDDTVQKRRLSRVAVADNRHRQPHPRRYVCIQFCSHSRRPFVKIVFSPPVACAPLSPSPSPGACAPSSPAPGTSRAVPASAFFHSRQPASALSKSTRSSRSGSTMPFLCRSVNRTVSGA